MLERAVTTTQTQCTNIAPGTHRPFDPRLRRTGEGFLAFRHALCTPSESTNHTAETDMESSTNDTFGNQNSGSASTGNAPATVTSDASFSREASNDTTAIADRARSAASSAGGRLADVGSTVRDKAGSLKHTLADALESGAERLRKQGAGSGQIAAASAIDGSADTVAEDNRLAQTSNQLAGGMQGAADWLRDADVDGLKAGIERQVKEHPGRSLAVAIGVGYRLGKAFRR